MFQLEPVTRSGTTAALLPEMLVGLIPGGMEELFYKYRTDDREFNRNGFLQEAKELHGTEYELP